MPQGVWPGSKWTFSSSGLCNSTPRESFGPGNVLKHHLFKCVSNTKHIGRIVGHSFSKVNFEKVTCSYGLKFCF